jgi:hypothetical protein
MSFWLPVYLVPILMVSWEMAAGEWDLPVKGQRYCCTAVVKDSTVAYMRPDTLSMVFAHLSPGDSVQAIAWSESGWLGFEPGVAQAANTGSFRYRWIPPSARLGILGDPDELPTVWVPETGTAYAMVNWVTPVYLEPDTLSAVLDSLRVEDAAAILNRQGDWLLVDPSLGPSGRGASGWVNLRDISISDGMYAEPRPEI